MCRGLLGVEDRFILSHTHHPIHPAELTHPEQIKESLLPVDKLRIIPIQTACHLSCVCEAIYCSVAVFSHTITPDTEIMQHVQCAGSLYTLKK